MRSKSAPSPEDLLNDPTPGNAGGVNDPTIEDELDIELTAEPEVEGKGILLKLVRLDLNDKDEKKLLIFECEVMDGVFAGRRVTDMFDVNNPNQAFKRNMWAKALKAPIEDNKVRFKRTELVGRFVVANIENDATYGSKIKSAVPATAEQATKHDNVL